MSRHTLVLAATLLAAACGTPHAPARITASGHVEATEVRIASKVGDRIDEFPVVEGDRVKAGQLLVRIDATDLRVALDAARAEHDLAGAELALRLAGARKEEIAEAQAVVTQAEADLAGAERELARMQGLLDAGSGTGKTRDDATTRRDVSASVLGAARERLARLKAGSRPQEIDAARARVAAAAQRVALIEQQLRDVEVVAPVGGIVTQKLAERGEVIARGAPLAVVTDLDNPWLTAYVAEPDLGRFRLGQPAEVRTDDGQVRTGKVTFVASQAEFTPKNVQTREERVKLVYRIKIALPNGDGLFKPGMPAEASLAADGR